MGGLCVIYRADGSPVNRELVESMAETAAYRAQDGIGYYLDGPVGIAALMTATTPESVGKAQPVIGLGGQVILAADARIDNRPTVIARLAGLGDVDADTILSDAELMLAAYLAWGDAFVEQLEGDFAFVLWDARHGQLVCGRDAMGIKALHYAAGDGFFCAATEIGQLMACPDVPRTLDQEAAAIFLRDGEPPGERTIFRAVRRIPVAGLLVYKGGEVSLRRYWRLEPGREIRYAEFEQYVEHLRELMRRAVGDRLRSVSPKVGVLMSGGLDSTSVAAVAQDLMRREGLGRHLVAATLVFEHLRGCDESEYSAATADWCGFELMRVQADGPEMMARAMEDADTVDGYFSETPFGPSFRRAAELLHKAGARVMLTGFGGDHLFQGSSYTYYDRFLAQPYHVWRDMAEHQRRDNLHWPAMIYSYLVRPSLPEPAQNLVRRVGGRRADPRPARPWLHSKVVAARAGASEPHGMPRRGQLSKSWLQKRISASKEISVNFTDRVAAWGGLDVRHPLLDRRLAEFVMAIPSEYLWNSGETKRILRRTVCDVLPDKVRLRKRKTNFDEFYRAMIADSVNPFIEPASRGERLQQIGIVHADGLGHTYRQLRANTQPALSMLRFWAALMLERWLECHCSLSQNVQLEA